MGRSLALWVLVALAAAAGGPDVDPEPAEIERLVAQLGSDDFFEREEAYTRLRDCAELALPALRRRQGDRDTELRLRARALIALIERKGDVLACRGHDGEVLAVALLPGDRQAITGGTDNTVRLWDLAAGSEVRRFEGHTQQVWCLAIAPDGKQFASGGQDRVVRIWDITTGRLVKTLPAMRDPIRCLAYTPDGQTLVIATFDARCVLFDLEQGNVLRTLGEQPGGTLSLAVSLDGKRALTGGSYYDRTVRLWDLETGSELERLVGHTERISGVAFLPGDRAVSAGQDKTIRVWDLKTGRELFRLTGHTGSIHSLALAPDGVHVLTGAGDDDATVRVWDLATREELRRYHGHTRYICSLAISATGKQFVSASSDKTLRLWNMPRMRRVK
jgi:WD40 repeat protein